VTAAPNLPPGPGVPPRWDVAVDGIRWLPRMIEKARMRQRGALGAYLLGHSPVDKALLKRLGLGTDEFVAIVARSADDAAVLAALRERGFDEAAVRRWSDDFPRRYATYIKLWDLDEGYVQAAPWQKTLIAGVRCIEGPLMEGFRRISGAP
jgi:hypothetical protein